jgi:AcrR family transcriptional regulator
VPVRPTLREAQKAFTRQLLIQAALEVFERDGYANATVDEIVKAASATRATFYQHLSGKRDVITALYEDLNEEGRVQFVNAWAPDSGRPTRASIREWLEDVVNWYRRHAASLRAIREAASQERDEPLETQGLRLAAADLAPHLDTAGARWAPELHALALLVQLDTFLKLWILNGVEVDEDAALEMLTGIWAEALGVT